MRRLRLNARLIASLGLCLGWFASLPTFAQVDVPAPLEPWRDWVLYGQEHLACPVLNGFPADQATSYVCAWPGEIAVDVVAGGAQFRIDWTTYAESWVPLPGNDRYWPADVTVDDEALPVVARNGRPTLRLGAGRHRIAGTLSWQTRPASIELPREIGLVALRVDGTAIENPELEQGTLWLGLRPEAAVEEDRLDVTVYRRLDDSLPMIADTVVDLDVAGQSREVVLDGALLDGFAGESLKSDLPAELDADGMLRVQVRPGRWRLTLTAHATDEPASITFPAATDPWPADEILSFEPNPRLRVAALEGLPAVDSRQSGVPAEWQDLPSYAVTAGQTVMIVERSRNDAAEPNRLSLRRDLWLDFDGGAFTARDDVSGDMRSGWRLDMGAPYTMTMASVNDENLLVTEGFAAGLQGVELRAGNVDLNATARIARDGALPITGYRESFDDALTVLHLPPGYRLLAASGANLAAGAWIESWRLLDIFLVLIITVAAWRLFGAPGGLIALGALVLSYHEPGAPHWAWLNVLFAIALVRVAPAGRLRAWSQRYQWLSLAGLVLLLLPFSALELRTVLYPQLEHTRLQRGVASGLAGGSAPFLRQSAAISAPTPEQMRRVNAADVARSPGALEEVVVTGSRIERAVSRYQPGALVQTGPGLPDWSWTDYTLRFDGPIDADQTFRPVLLGPWSTAIWRIASVALAAALLLVLVRREFRIPAWPLRAAHAKALVPLLVTAAGLTAAPRTGHAQPLGEFPSPGLLDELKRRLMTPEPCHPDCAELTNAAVTLADGTLRIDLEYAAQDTVAVPIPTVPRTWRPTSVQVDGAEVRLLYRDRSEQSWLSVDDGVHTVSLSGPIPPTNSFTLPFLRPPRRISVDAPGWDIAGIADGRLPSGALEFIRQAVEGEDGADALTGSVFPPYVRVTRNVTFDLDWTVTTEVERVAPADGAFTLAISLLPGEAVVTPGIDVADGRATAAFVAGQQTVSWSSRLATVTSLALNAPEGMPWMETWLFSVGQIWHADFAGLPSTPPMFENDSFYTPEYDPRPGETLTINLVRPAPASGDTIAIDSVEYERDVGARASESTLNFEYRSTRGMDHTITLPENSQLDYVEIDAEEVPLQLDGNTLGIPITPGSHEVEIAWRNPEGVAFRSTLPVVGLGGGASNIETTLDLPADRWILLAYGPTLGPAILYWPELLLFGLAGLILGRIPLSPLKTHEWLLLGLGLSTFAWPVLLIFAAWAFTMSWRGRSEPKFTRPWFNAMQAGLGLFTLVAVGAVVGAIPLGLLGRPDMQIVTPVDYGGGLDWFLDRAAELTPAAGVVSVSQWFYRAAMLGWSLWLSFALLRWLPWAWRSFAHGGLWRGRIATGTGAA